MCVGWSSGSNSIDTSVCEIGVHHRQLSFDPILETMQDFGWL
jgi:hypothetical protein